MSYEETHKIQACFACRKCGDVFEVIYTAWENDECHVKADIVACPLCGYRDQTQLHYIGHAEV